MLIDKTSRILTHACHKSMHITKRGSLKYRRTFVMHDIGKHYQRVHVCSIRVVSSSIVLPSLLNFSVQKSENDSIQGDLEYTLPQTNKQTNKQINKQTKIQSCILRYNILINYAVSACSSRSIKDQKQVP